MKTLILYSKTTGRIISTQSGSINEYVDGEISNISIDVPDGKIIDKVDTTTNAVILTDIPKTELELTQEQLLATQAQIASLQEQILLK